MKLVRILVTGTPEKPYIFTIERMRNANNLWALINLPNKPWNWFIISGNPNTTFEIIHSETQILSRKFDGKIFPMKSKCNLGYY